MILCVRQRFELLLPQDADHLFVSVNDSWYYQQFNNEKAKRRIQEGFLFLAGVRGMIWLKPKILMVKPYCVNNNMNNQIKMLHTNNLGDQNRNRNLFYFK